MATEQEQGSEPQQELPYGSIVHNFIDEAYRQDRRPYPDIEFHEVGARGKDMRYYGFLALFPTEDNPIEGTGDFDMIGLRYQNGRLLKHNPFSWYESIQHLPELVLSTEERLGINTEVQIQTNKNAQLANQPVIVMQIGYNAQGEVGARVFHRPAYSLAESVHLIKSISHAVMLQKAPLS